uniref:Platelet glycoprotein V-like n=1 Tax=Neolamprologus brichardi TaxID=32507 RepID=A0A3Q4HMD0_NEOBR
MNVLNERSLANLDLLLRFSLIKSHLHTVHPQAFLVAPQLKSVNRNKLRSLDSDIFEGLTNLTFLNLGRNFIKKLPPTIFHSLTKLQQLILYYNELEFLETGIFDELINLVELKLHQNQIASLPPKVFWPLGNLKNLTLSANQLQLFSKLTTLNKLHLNDNKLYGLPEGIFKALINLTLSGNPWDCNCAIRDDVMCHAPVYQLLRTVGSLHDEEFSFCSATTAKSFPLQDLNRSPTQPLHMLSTSGQTSALTSITTPPTTATQSKEAAIQTTRGQMFECSSIKREDFRAILKLGSYYPTLVKRFML